ncbi:MAG TPA: DUF134 domain-containing protein [Rectinemataceae bacterium]|nr:DUF134 domain-containing protein [Rectinemataceae bacterium]
MPRPVNERRLGIPISSRTIAPIGSLEGELEGVFLGLDEAEALRLADLEGLYQEAAARSMGVSRQTFGRIVESARRKVADAVLNGKALRIEGGEVSLRQEGESIMKIAVPSRNGQVDEHFGHCKEFLVFRYEGGRLVAEPTVASGDSCGCKSGIASELARAGVTHLVAGNMGEGALRVLGANGIVVTRGAVGDAAAAALAFAQGGIVDSGVGCASHEHHGQGHEEGHSCEHGHHGAQGGHGPQGGPSFVRL